MDCLRELNALPESEQDICGRLRQFRETLQIPRTKFALSIGISGERLASYEAGRARLRFEIFAAINRRYSLNPVWLVTGKGKPVSERINTAKFAGQIQPRALFSVIYDTLLSKQFPCETSDTLSEEDVREFKELFRNREVLSRLKKVRVSLGRSPAWIAENLKSESGEAYPEKVIDLVESGMKNLSVPEMIRWVDALENSGLNLDWLQTGKGEMIVERIVLANSADNGTEGFPDLIHAVAALREQAERLSSGLRAIELAIKAKNSG